MIAAVLPVHVSKVENVIVEVEGRTEIAFHDEFRSRYIIAVEINKHTLEEWSVGLSKQVCRHGYWQTVDAEPEPG